MNVHYQKVLGVFLAVSIIALVISFFVEYVIEIHPCILCQLQRIPYIATIVLALIALFIRPKKFMTRLIQLLFVGGITIATYHSLIQFGFFRSPCQNAQIKRNGPSWRIFSLPPPLYNGVFSLTVLVGTELFLVQTRKKKD